MFTGIIQSIGEVQELRRQADGATLVVRTGLAGSAVALGDSIAIDGCCQTVAAFTAEGLCTFHVLNETLNRTIFGSYRGGSRVNVEAALRLGDRMGGHIVTGHVDCTGEVLAIRPRGGDRAIVLRRPEAAGFPLVPKGSIAINGVSLTVAELTADSVTVCVIPHTWSHTDLNALGAGSRVNLEADLLGKYVAALAAPYQRKEPDAGKVTMESLASAGFL